LTRRAEVMIATVVVPCQCAVAPVTVMTATTNVTVTTLDQPAQQPRLRRRTPRTQLEILMADLADTIKRVTVDNRRHRDRDPLLARALSQAGLAAAGRALDPFVAVVVDRADVRLVAQYAVNRRRSPLRLAGRRRDPSVAQLKRDLANRQAPLDVRCEDLAHHLGLGLEDLDPGTPAPVGDHPAVPVGDLPERDLARPSAIQLPATVALGDLGLLVFGNHALHLHQQRRLRILARRRTLQKPDLDPQALELLEDQHLVGVGSSQAIHAQAEYPVEHARLGSIAQAIKRRATSGAAGA
jgi:hypothetical protein